ncbi:MAG: AsmA family protein, partial [Proteobacteria bacterium]|nr:AsmA family protein [Pseudomonadota bacterium]
MRKLLIGIAATFVVLIAVALVAPSFIDWNDYRDTITAQIESATGRQVTIDGDIGFAVLPSPALSVDGLKISNIPDASAPDFATLKSLDIEVAFWPLLTGTIEVTRIVLVDPVIELEILPDGQQSWDFTASNEDTENDAGLDVSVERFLMENGTVIFRDGADESQRLDGLTVELSAQSMSGPFELAGDLNINDVPVSLQLAVGRIDAKRISVEAEVDVVDRNVQLTFSGAGTLDDESRSLVGQLALSAAGLDTLINGTAVGGKNEGLAHQPLLIQGQVLATNQRVALDDLELSIGAIKGKGAFSYGLGPDAAFKLLINLSAIDADGLMVPEEPGSGSSTSEADSFALPAALRGEVEITVAVITYQGGTIRQGRLAAEIADGQATLNSFTALLPGGSDLALSGSARPTPGGMEFGGKVRLGSANPRTLMGWLGIDLSTIPLDRLTQLSLEGGLSADADQVQLHDISLQIDTTKVSGGAAVGLHDRASFNAVLNVDRFNLDAYLGSVTDETTDWKKDLAVFDDFDTKLKVSFGRILLGQLTMDDVSTDLELLDGVLTINQLNVRDVDGATASITGSLRDFGSELAWNIALHASTKQAGSLMRMAGIEPTSAPMVRSPANLHLESQGNLGKADISIDGALGSTAISVKGIGRKWDAVDRELTLEISAGDPSWDVLSRQLDLAMISPMQGHDGPVALKGQISGKGSSYQTDLAFDLAGGQLGIKGPITDADGNVRLNLAIVAKGVETRAILRGLGVDFDPAGRDLGAVLVSGSVIGTAEVFSISGLTAKLGPASLTGALAFDASGARPRFDLTINAEKLNRDSLLPIPETGAKIVRQDGGERWSREPMDFSLLREMDGRISFAADEFQVRRYQFDTPKAVLLLRNGKLLLTSFSGFLFGGEAWGAATLDATAVPSLTVNLRLTEASMGQALAAIADQQTATGLFNLTGTDRHQQESQLAMISN